MCSDEVFMDMVWQSQRVGENVYSNDARKACDVIHIGDDTVQCD